MNQFDPATDRRSEALRANRWRRRFFTLAALVLLVPAAVLVYAAARFLEDEPVTYEAIEEHFKYGSTGGERVSGFPYWIWQAMPHVCANHMRGS
jgi:hypothetical protein